VFALASAAGRHPGAERWPGQPALITWLTAEEADVICVIW
jgi:hypothetical protein